MLTGNVACFNVRDVSFSVSQVIISQWAPYMHRGRCPVTSHLVQVVVKICISSTKVASEQCGMSGENRGQRDAAGAAQDQPGTGLPLVEVSNHVGLVAQLVCQLEEPQVRIERSGVD